MATVQQLLSFALQNRRLVLGAASALSALFVCVLVFLLSSPTTEIKRELTHLPYRQYTTLKVHNALPNELHWNHLLGKVRTRPVPTAQPSFPLFDLLGKLIDAISPPIQVAAFCAFLSWAYQQYLLTVQQRKEEEAREWRLVQTASPTQDYPFVIDPEKMQKATASAAPPMTPRQRI